MLIPRSVWTGSVVCWCPDFIWNGLDPPLSSLRSGASWSKLRWTEVGLRNQKNRPPLTYFLFQAPWTRVNPHLCDDVGNKRSLAIESPTRAFWVTAKMRWVTKCSKMTFDAFKFMTSDTRRQMYYMECRAKIFLGNVQNFLVHSRKTHNEVWVSAILMSQHMLVSGGHFLNPRETDSPTHGREDSRGCYRVCMCKCS